jgi:PAS domain S-box-containing protein
MAQWSCERKPLFDHPIVTDEASEGLAFNAGVAQDTLPQLFEKVERAKQEWEATIDSLPELICLLDERGQVLRASRAIETWGLAKVTQVQGCDFHQLLHPNCFAPFCNLHRFIEEARQSTPSDRSTEVEMADPILSRYLRIRVQTIATRDRYLPTTVVVIQDITYHKTTEAALQRYTARLEAMTELQRAILSAGSPEDIAYAALARLRQLLPFCQAQVILQAAEARGCQVIAADANGTTHLRPSQFCAWSELGVMDPHWFESVLVVDDLLAQGQVSPFEQQLVDQQVRSYCSIPLLAEADFIGALFIASDRPDAFQSEPLAIAHEIGNLLAIATHQAQLYRRLKDAHAGLQLALRAKEQLIQNVSHELRTPITLIYGYTSLLADGELGPVAEEQKRGLQIMLKQEEQLQFMVDRLVELRILDVEQLHRQPLDVAEWLPLVVKPWSKRAELTAHPLSVEIDLPMPQPAVSVDLAALKQVLDNLLDNAIKFSAPGTGIRVAARIEGDQLVIAVQDQGIGLRPGQIERVFEQFYQVDGSTTRQFGGMGIGLALCQGIMEAHGGCIWAESAGEGHGSTFWCALPINAP